MLNPFAFFKKEHYSPRKLSCYSNIRVLLGAVEMYNMDKKNTIMSTLDQSILVKEGYIKSDKLVCPESSEYTYSGEHLTEGGEIICSYHGGVETNESYNKEQEIGNQIGNRILQFLGECIVRLPGALLWPLGLALFVLRIIP